MKVDLYEKWWMWLSVGLIVFFTAAIVFITVAGAVVPPSHIETIDPTTLATDPRFSNPGVTTSADGSQQVVVQSLLYAFLPVEIRVTAGVPVTFRMTS